MRAVQQVAAQDISPVSKALAEAASRTKPIVVLLRDPALLGRPLPRDTQGKANAAEDSPEILRLNAAHAALQLLEDQWQALASELGFGVSEGHQQRKQEQQQQQQLLHSNPLVPNLRDLFSVHIVFITKPTSSSTVSGMQQQLPPASCLTACTAALQSCLRSVLSQHYSREIVNRTQSRPSKQQTQQENEQEKQQEHRRVVSDESNAGGSNALGLFDAAVTQCRVFLSEPESANQLRPLTIPRDTFVPEAPREFTLADAVAFDAEVYKQRSLARCVCRRRKELLCMLISARIAQSGGGGNPE